MLMASNCSSNRIREIEKHMCEDTCRTILNEGKNERIKEGRASRDTP